jgi:hypothetical protein
LHFLKMQGLIKISINDEKLLRNYQKFKIF